MEMEQNKKGTGKTAKKLENYTAKRNIDNDQSNEKELSKEIKINAEKTNIIDPTAKNKIIGKTENFQPKRRNENIQKGQIIQIGTWNVRTLYQAGNLAQVLKEMDRYKIDMLGLSEVRWNGYGELKVGNYHIIYSGQETESRDHQYGVAFILNKKIRDILINWKPIDERIIKMRLKIRKKYVSIIQCYAPTNVADDDKKELFYNRLSAVLEEIPREELILMTGDFNAKVGTENAGFEDIMGKEGLSTRNENGELMQELCGMYQLKIGGTLFTHKDCHKITWTSPDGKTVSQIDHICISKKFSKLMIDVRNKRGAEVGSDHYLLLAKVRLNIQKEKRIYIPNHKLDLTKLKSRNIRKKFAQILKRRQERINYKNSIQEVWEQCKEIYIGTGQEVLGNKTNGRKKWMSGETWKKIEERKSIKQKILCTQIAEKETILQMNYKIISKEIKKSVRKDKQTYIEDIAKEAQVAAEMGNNKVLYSKIRELSENRRTCNIIKSREQQILTTEEEQIERWAEYFKELLNIQREEIIIAPEKENILELNINTDPPNKEELIEAIESLKNNKSPGIDQITGELLKADVNVTTEILLPLFEKIWKEEKFPKDWQTGVIVKIPKKGDLKLCNNWRGITLLSTVNKLFSKIILNRIVNTIDDGLRKEQNGFRRGRSCIDLINTLRIITEQATEQQSLLYLVYIDFEKAFDSISRENIWISLKNRGLPIKLINLIKEGYNNYKSVVQHQGKLSRKFETETGVKQGCILSPLLFSILLDDVMRKAINNKKKGIQWGLTENLEDLDFADDICLLSQNRQHMQDKIEALETEASKVGLKINKGKTKSMSLNATKNIQLRVREGTIEEVDEFNYLGSIISKNNGVLIDVDKRINKARSTFARLNKIWRTSTLTTYTKIKVFKAMVKPVLLYGAESWTITKTIENKLQVFINRCLRRIFKIWWPEVISNRELWARAEEEEIGKQIRKRKFGWLGHTLRKSENEIPKKVLHWNPQGKRKQGRPKETWIRSTQAEANMTFRQMSYIAKNRQKWKNFSTTLCPQEG